MKKVECPSCGGTGIIRYGRWAWEALAYHQCRKCAGFGFILIDPAVFPEFKPIKVTRNTSTHTTRMNTHYFAMEQYREFTGLTKVRNVHHVLVGQLAIPYSTFYKEHRSHR